MGVVYKATDPLIHRVVAIKMVSLPVILSDQQRMEFNERFFREAQAAGNLHHPNIVTIFDVGEENGVPFMAQEFIEGESLSKILEREGAMDFDAATNILRQMADALQFAHSQGVVHRDVKPDNILVERGGRAVLTDFGVARLSSSDLTRTGEVLGTPHFMSPEQVLGEPVDGRSDIFSLGVVFYLLLTGKKPYSGDSVTSVCYQIVHSQLALPEGIKLPPGTAYVLEKLMAKSKDDRFADGAEILETLDQMQDGTVALRAGVPVLAEDPASSPTRVLAEGIPPATPGEGTDPTQPLKPESAERHASKGLSGRALLLLGGIGLLGIILVGFLAFFVAVRLGNALDSRKKPSSAGDAAVNQPFSSPLKPRSQPMTAKDTVAILSTKRAVQKNAGSAKSSTLNARIGLIVEGGLQRGFFQVYANGRKELSVPFKGRRVDPSGYRYGFRIVQKIELKPGHYDLKFILSSPRPTAFTAHAQRSLDVKSGDEYLVKIGPRRFPARLKVTIVEQKRGQ